jgi:hypothetical protein
LSSIEAPNADSALPATRADTETLANMLAAAFQNDALAQWIIPDDDRRAKILPEFFRVSIETSLEYNAVYTNSSRDAALLFLPPGAWEEVELRGVELSQRLAEILGDDVERFATINGLQTIHHPTGRTHYYITYAGVDPANQRHGAMAALLNSLVARADADGVPMYTEASSSGGLLAAQRAGFVKVGQTLVIPDGPTLQPMWREPR